MPDTFCAKGFVVDNISMLMMFVWLIFEFINMQKVNKLSILGNKYMLCNMFCVFLAESFGK